MADPNLAALLGGSPAGLPPAIGGPGAGLPPAGLGGGSEDDPISILKQMIDLGKQYVDAEPDEEDKATMMKLLATLQQYLAKDQADADQALGNKSTARLLRKSG